MRGGVLRRFVVCLSLAAPMAVVPACVSAAAGSVPGAAWDVAFIAHPTNLLLTRHQGGEPEDQYVLVLTNTGEEESHGTVEVTVALPAGVTLAEPAGGSGWGCPTAEGSVVTCFYGGVPGLGRSGVLRIPVAVTEAGVRTAAVTVSGGGAPIATVTRATEVTGVGGHLPPFGFVEETFSSLVSNVSGLPDIQAGDHPFALTTSVDFPQHLVGTRKFAAVQWPKAVVVDLPAGVTGDPQAAPRCPVIEVLADTCPAGTLVGTFMANYEEGLFEGSGASPIYNVVPERGYPAEFGFYASKRVVIAYASLRAAPEYGLHITIPDLPYEITTNALVTFFGDPAAMDGSQNSPAALLTNPTSCLNEPEVTRIEADSWEAPTEWVPANARGPPMTGCDRLQFHPAITVRPDTTLADEPTGYGVELEVPQSQTSGVEGLATPDLKNVTVTLPQGVSLSAGAADGLAACPTEGPEGINLTSTEAGHCPLASQVGTVEALTPVLEQPLTGHVYVAVPGCGGAGQAPCTEADAANGTLFGAYLELEGSGIVIKQHGALSANPVTGQLTASFKDAPQQPFSDLKITLKDGPRAPLSNPQTCGEALTTSDVTPWSSPQTPDATPSWAFQVTGCEGSPFAPAFEAGTTNPAAGAYTNVTATFSRGDRQQDFSALQVQAPPGLLAMISHVPLCEEPQAALGTCSPASRIGTATASAGAGSHPFWVSGPVYLTGPYRGAPFGLSAPIQAKAGPFNLGTIVTRAMLNVDPTTAAATVTSDPLPQIFDGIPLRVQTINVTLNRSQFAFNPTNCEAHQITATIASAQGAVAHVSSPFAAGGCKNLPFDPGFKVATRAPGSKKKGTSFDAKVSSEPGQANIRSVAVTLPKQLPARLTTIQQACPEATFAANPATCPAGSAIGVATAITPVLSVPFTGPAYLVSHGGAAFPDIEVILQGDGVRIDLTGSINIAHGITSSTFANAPDAPISSFELKLPEGPHSALTTNSSLCAKPLVMPTTIVGQNGRRLVRSTKISVSGCPKKKPKPKKKRGK